MSNSGLDPSDLGDDNSVHHEDYFAASSLDTLTDVPKNMFTDTVSMTGESQDGFETVKPEKFDDKGDPQVYMDEDARMFFAPITDINSPRDIVSPTEPDHGELSSLSSAMESDGMETGIDDASLSAGGGNVRRPTGFFGASTPLEYTTTPGASSSACDENYESSGSRKKRRKTRRDMHPSYNTVRLDNGPQLRLPKSTNAAASETWSHDGDLSPFSPPTCPRNMNFNFGESSSRRSSGGLSAQPIPTEYVHDKSKRTKTCDTSTCDITNIKTEVISTGIVNNETPKMINSNSNRRRNTHHRASASTTAAETESFLQKQFPKKYGQYELRILSQPEAQHRARYLTEGSRGPVKDATTQGYPKVQLLGYSGKLLKLQVFVATDTGKVRPHGFYQACRVTGRNTSPCEETEIEGTQVIEIPFKDDNNDMTLNVDCVGILKLRNTDVEVRTGVRNQKRNQSVRLVFRVSICDPQKNVDLILQVASSRISCTQPLGQPEITKKSLDRCSVEGGIDMFIIGKNFHRGTKVVYQDPEQPDGQQWSSEGEVDKDTFHASHMVVKIPAYHDQDIVKPVNVQLFVEFQDKKCEPHSFTYMPKHREPAPVKEEAEKSQQISENLENSSSIENVINMKLPDGPIDKKFLVELFSKLFAGGISAQNGSQEKEAEQVKNEPLVQAPVAAFALNNTQNFVNPAVVMPQSQPQPFLAQVSSIPQAVQVGTVNSKPPFNIASTGATTIPVSNPVANFQFVQPSAQIPINVNPMQLASYTTILGSGASANIKTLPVDTNVTLLSTNANVKHEQSGTDSLLAPVVMATLPAAPTIQSVTNQSTPIALVQPMAQATQSSVSYVQNSQTAQPSAVMGLPVSKQNFDQGSQQTFIKPAEKFVSSPENTINVPQFGQNIFGGQCTVQTFSAPSMTSPQQKPNQVTATTNFHVSPGQQNLFDGLAVVQNSGSFINPPSVKLTQSMLNNNNPQLTVRNVQNSSFGLNQPILQANLQQPITFPFPATFELKNAEKIENIVTDATMQESGAETKQEMQFQLTEQQQTAVSQHAVGTFTKIEQFPVVIQPPQSSVNTEQQFMTSNQQQQATLSPTNFGDAKQGFTVDIQPNLIQQTQQTAFKIPMQQFTVGGPQDSQPFSNNEPQISPQQLGFNKAPDIQFTIGGQQASTTFSSNESQVSQQITFNKSPDIPFTVGSQQGSIPFPRNEPQVPQQQTQLSFNKSPDVQFTDNKEQINIQQQSMPQQQIMNVLQSETSPHGMQGQQKVQMQVDTYANVTPMQTSNSDVQQQSNTGTFISAPPPTIPLVAMEKAQPMEDVHHSNSVQPVVSQVQQNAPIMQQQNFQATNIAQMTSNFQTPLSIINTPVCMGVHFSTPTQTFQISQQSADVKMVPVATSMAIGSFQQQKTNPNQPNITSNVNETQMFQASLTQQHISPLQQTQTFPTSQAIQPVQSMITNQAPQEVIQRVYQQPQEQCQQTTIMTTLPDSHSMQMHGDFTHPVTNNVTMTSVNDTTVNFSLPQQQQTENRNIAPNAALGHTPDSFAMSQLLQSIDGSENLAAITEEDVTRQFQ